MTNEHRKLALRYALALALVVIATGVRELLDPLLAERAAFVTYFATVVAAAWFLGCGPAIATAIASSVAALYFFAPPQNSLLVTEPSDAFGLVMFLFVGLATALLSRSRLAALNQMASQTLTLKEEAKRFDVTLTNIGDGVILVDPEGRISFMNRVAEKFTGQTAADARGRPVEEVYVAVSDRTRKVAENPARKVIETREPVALPGFLTLLSTGGDERPIDDRAVPLFADDGAFRGALLVFRDDTHRRKARKALRASEIRFRTLADSAPVLIWMTDAQGKSNFFNQPWLEFTGRTLQQEAGQGWHEGIHPDDVRLCTTTHREAFESRQEFQLEYRLRRADGEYRWLLDHGIPLYGADGEFTGYIGSCVDITRLREATDALRTSEARFRALAENAPAAIFVKDLEGRYVMANPLARQALGSPHDVIGRTDHDLLPAELADQLRANDRLVIATGQSLESEDDFTHSDQTRMFLAVKFPLYDGQGRAAGVCGVAIDITDRKRADEALRDSEEKFRLMSDSIPQLAWMARPDGHIFWYNQRWYDYTGATPEEMHGWGWQSVHDPRHLQRVLQSFKASIASGEPWEDTFPLRRHDGAMRWHLSLALPVRNQQGEVVRWFGTNTDVTETRQTENTLRFLSEASESLSSLVDYRQTLQKVAELAVPSFADWCAVDMITDGAVERFAVAHVDPEKQALVRALAEHQVMRLSDAVESAEPADELQSQWIEEVTEATLDRWARDAEHRRMLGELAPVSLIRVPCAVHGATRGLITFATSSSNRRFTSDDLAVAEDLAHRVGVATENARLYQELREADRRKDEFLAMLAHELRNPLAPIRTGLDLLTLDPATNGKAVRLMQKQVEHLVRLVDDLLDVSRIMRGKVELRREKVRLNDLLQQAVDATESLIRQQDHRLRLSPADESIWLDADPVRIVQIIENLITNACKYTDRGGLIELTARVEDDQAVIAVRDNGMGIEPELLPKVFDLFSQASRSLDRSQGGLGIGLTLVRTLVEMHGGSVSAASEGSQRGSQFQVRLPTAEPGGEAAAEASRFPAGARRVLIVDDNEAAADMLRLLLQRLDAHRVEAVYNGGAALEKIDAFRPEVVLLDIGLPGKNGYEIAREIRANSAYDSILLVALTGYGQEEDRRRSQEAGFDVHLVKPPSTGDIQSLFFHPKLGPPSQLAAERPSPTTEAILQQAASTADADAACHAIEQRPPSFDTIDHQPNPSEEHSDMQQHEVTDEEQEQIMRDIIHDLGNSAHVVAMAAKILQQSSDSGDIDAVQQMLEGVGRSMRQNMDSLRSQLAPPAETTSQIRS